MILCSHQGYKIKAQPARGFALQLPGHPPDTALPLPVLTPSCQQTSRTSGGRRVGVACSRMPDQTGRPAGQEFGPWTPGKTPAWAEGCWEPTVPSLGSSEDTRQTLSPELIRLWLPLKGLWEWGPQGPPGWLRWWTFSLRSRQQADLCPGAPPPVAEISQALCPSSQAQAGPRGHPAVTAPPLPAGPSQGAAACRGGSPRGSWDAPRARTRSAFPKPLWCPVPSQATLGNWTGQAQTHPKVPQQGHVMRGRGWRQ